MPPPPDLAVICQACDKPTRVPNRVAEKSAENAVKISDLQHQLKENESQRTEITSYINQHSIQLHRWQLRLKDLNDRKAKLDAELQHPHGRQRPLKTGQNGNRSPDAIVPASRT